ncbi:unnamed protein product [Microthlaspi erraticum]|uniref:DUF287 domain-containing protein n=1 Tax=Microthlaspi erraticum TaxID=1685480 RepID=A0A6D2I826_9BRAS|nr:unnamed protein product [Microthlaspi erraticum]
MRKSPECGANMRSSEVRNRLANRDYLSEIELWIQGVDFPHYNHLHGKLNFSQTRMASVEKKKIWWESLYKIDLAGRGITEFANEVPMQAPDNGGSVQGMMETMKALIEEATKKLEDKMDDVTSEIKAMVGDLDERLDMVECYVNEQRTKKAHDRSGASSFPLGSAFRTPAEKVVAGDISEEEEEAEEEAEEEEEEQGGGGGEGGGGGGASREPPKKKEKRETINLQLFSHLHMWLVRQIEKEKARQVEKGKEVQRDRTTHVGNKADVSVFRKLCIVYYLYVL